MTGSYITKARIDDNVKDTDNYDTVSYNREGEATHSTVELVPLFVVGRVDFDVSGGGSPSRKYLRAVLSEGDISFVSLGATAISRLNAFGDAIVAIGTICDPQGQLFVDAVVWPAPQMRQLRRGSKKKSTPSSPTPV